MPTSHHIVSSFFLFSVPFSFLDHYSLKIMSSFTLEPLFHQPFRKPISKFKSSEIFHHFHLISLLGMSKLVGVFLAIDPLNISMLPLHLQLLLLPMTHNLLKLLRMLTSKIMSCHG